MVTQNLTLSYPDVYGKDPDVTIDSLLQGIDLNFASGLIEILNKNEQNYNSTEKLVDFLRLQWFGRHNTAFFLFLEKVILALDKKNEDAGVVIFNAPGTLTFLEHLLRYLQVYGDEKDKRPGNGAMEKNLLDAYLIINQQKGGRAEGIAELKKDFPEEEIFWLCLYKPFQYADLVNRDLQELYFTEISKAVMFFTFLQQDAKTAKILNTFLERYECPDWEQYLKAISGMSVMALNTANNQGNNFVHLDPELPFLNTCLKILDAIEIQLEAVDLAEDHLFLRNHPVLRAEKDKFQIIYRRFFIEKIFRALYFELSQINDELKVMKRDQFRTQVYTSGYSENTLLYQVLDHIFEKAETRIHGEVMEKADPQFGASDYVSFHHGSVFLFESKDVLIRKAVKDKMYLPELREELRLKFYRDGSDKGVLQLARNIKKVLEGSYERFGLVFQKHRFIYPVLVVHSDAFNVIGLNQLLQRWFLEACAEVGLTKKQLHKIKPVVLIDISTLVYYQDTINKKYTDFDQLIDSYAERTKLGRTRGHGARNAVNYASLYLIPFATYVQYQIRSKKSLRAPKNIVDKVSAIFLNKKVRDE